MNNALYNSNTCIGYKLRFFFIRNVHLNVNEQAIVDTLIALIDVELDNWLLIILIMIL